MEKLDAILKSHVAVGDDTTNKLLGAAFVVVGKDGARYPKHLSYENGIEIGTDLASRVPIFGVGRPDGFRC